MASAATLSSCVDSHSLPLSTSSDSSLHRADSLASTNLYVTFKVLQLVKSLRKKAKTRSRANRLLRKANTTRLTEDLCQDLELQAYEDIDRYLGRKSIKRPRKRTFPKSKYSRSSEVESRSTHQPEDPAIATLQDQSSSRRVQWLLNELDQAAKSESHSLVVVAKDHELFLAHTNEYCIGRLSLKELTRLLVIVKSLLDTLRQTASSPSQSHTFGDSHPLLDLLLDETQTANLEHLLLTVRDHLLRSLVLKLVDVYRKQLLECQREKSRHCEEWFSEFPDARHPLSTTWPWSIRPSLAVIWGVCWMFYDRQQNNYHRSRRYTDEDLVSPADAEQILSQQELDAMMLLQQQSHPYHSSNLGQAGFQHRPPPRHAFTHLHSPFAGQIMAEPHHQSRGLTVATTPQYARSPDLPARASAHGLDVAGTNHSYSAAPPASYAASAQPVPGIANWPSLPEENFYPFPSSFQHASAHGVHDAQQWDQLATAHVEQQQQSHFNANWQSYAHAGLPPRSRNSVTPDIRVITDANVYPGIQQQPQDSHHSATSISTASSYPLLETPYNTYSSSHLSPQYTRTRTFMDPDEKMAVGRTPSHSPHHSPRTMAAAVLDEQQLSRKRSHDEMVGNQTSPQMPENPYVPLDTNGGGHSRSGSVASQHQDFTGGEVQSPRTRTIKRGDPPNNEFGKMICDFAEECQGITFDRKCEWSKHMDKHDRPYRCQHTECAKLQGFTYSGGLLRHEREVHNKHGGPKMPLVCPFDDCKRHTGKGFTRKENLAEHVRRVHENKGQSQPQTQSQSQSQAQGPPQSALEMARESIQELETPYYADPVVDLVDPDHPDNKRRRYDQDADGLGASAEVEDLRQENDRLQSEHREKDALIRNMQEQMAEMQQSIQLLQAAREPEVPKPVRAQE